MFKKAIIVLGVSSVFASTAFADTTSSEELTGIGSGALVGGLVGGPVGAIIGGIVGVKIGDEFHQRNENIDDLQVSLSDEQQRSKVLSADVSRMQREIHSKEAYTRTLEDQQRPELVAMFNAGIAMDLLFKTDETVLTETTVHRLNQLAAMIANDDSLYIQLDGYADVRGDEDYNYTLSANRAAFVQELLVTAGVPESRISVNAFGESAAGDETIDSLALERRVTLTIYSDESAAMASLP